MRIKELLQQWTRSGGERRTVQEYTVHLPVHDAARLAALAEMFPLKSEEDILVELLSASLDEVEAGFPYVEGDKVIAEDEQGDPIFEDVGPTPRFLALSRKHSARLSAEAEAKTDST